MRAVSFQEKAFHISFFPSYFKKVTMAGIQGHGLTVSVWVTLKIQKWALETKENHEPLERKT